MSDSIKFGGVTLDGPDAGELAAFYAGITGGEVMVSGDSWALMTCPDGSAICFQGAPAYSPPTWPDAAGLWSTPGPRLVRDDGADVVRPLRFATAAGSLLGLDRLPAGFAGLPGGVGGVIFPRTLAAVAAAGIRNSLALARDIGQLSPLGGFISGHLHSLTRLPVPGTGS